MTRRSVATAVAAVLGIAVSATLAWAASQLAGQRVGLSSEPLSVATGLAPRTAPTGAATPVQRGDDRSAVARRRRSPAPRTTSTLNSPPTTARPAPSVTGLTAPAIATQPSTPASTTAAQTSTAGDGGSSAPGSANGARRPGRHGDGGDQHDD